MKLTRLLTALFVLLIALQLRVGAAVTLCTTDADNLRASTQSKPGDIVILAPNPAYAPLVWFASGTPANPILVISQIPGQAVFSGGTADDLVVKGNDVYFDGIRAEKAGRCGVFAAKVTGIRFTRCEATECGDSGFLTGHARGVVFDRCRSWNNKRQHGFYVSGDSDGAIVRDCFASNNGGAAIQFNTQGEQITPGDPAHDGVTSGAVIEGNLCDGNNLLASSQINLIGFQDGVIRNNQIVNGLGGGVAFSSAVATNPDLGSKRNRIEGNTITFRAGEGSWALSFSQGSASCEVRGNTFVGGRSGVFDIRAGLSVMASQNTYSVPAGAAFWSDNGRQAGWDDWLAHGQDVGSTLKPLGIEP